MKNVNDPYLEGNHFDSLCKEIYKRIVLLFLFG